VGEHALIRAIRARVGSLPGVAVGIGDDCAVLDVTHESRLLATTDLLVEDVHFRRRYTSPADIGWKALAVNLSDIASMGGRPRWALVAFACPAATDVDEVDAFYRGALALASEYEVAIVGGDTSASPSGWIVNVTLLGETSGPPLLRSTAQVGDVVAVTGSLGGSAAGLALLAGEGGSARLDAASVETVTTAHRRPTPRVREGQWLGAAGGVRAMIDLSDGLVTDLGHIAEESAVGARIELGRLPVSEATLRVADVLGHDPVAWATGGGEDYELLLTCMPGAFDRLASGLRRATGTRLAAIGEIVSAADGVHFVDARGTAVTLAPGFEHFAGDR
jgi:thiamine-monophosphate kinase